MDKTTLEMEPEPENYFKEVISSVSHRLTLSFVSFQQSISCVFLIPPPTPIYPHLQVGQLSFAISEIKNLIEQLKQLHNAILTSVENQSLGVTHFAFFKFLFSLLHTPSPLSHCDIYKLTLFSVHTGAKNEKNRIMENIKSLSRKVQAGLKSKY